MNPYEILEISPGATPDEIKQAYHRLAKQWHPDRFTGAEKAQAEDRFRQLAEAFGMLKDVVRREAAPPEVPAQAAPEVVAAPSASATPTPRPMAVEDWLRQGEDALLKGDHDRALGLAHYVLRLDASKTEHHLLLAKALEATDGDPRAQVKALEAALMLAPQDVDIMIRLAALFEKVGMVTRAQGLRDRARALKPDHPAFRPPRGAKAAKAGAAPPAGQPSFEEQFRALVGQVKGAWMRLAGRK